MMDVKKLKEWSGDMLYDAMGNEAALGAIRAYENTLKLVDETKYDTKEAR